MVAHLKHCLFPCVVAGHGALDTAELDFVAGIRAADIGVKGGFQQTVPFPPVQDIFPLYQRCIGAEYHVLDQVRVFTYRICAVDAELNRAVGSDAAFQQAGVRRQLHHTVGIDIPAVPASGYILAPEKLAEGTAAPFHAVCQRGQGGNKPRFVKAHPEQRRGEYIARKTEGRRLGCRSGFRTMQTQYAAAQSRPGKSLYRSGAGAVGPENLLDYHVIVFWNKTV